MNCCHLSPRGWRHHLPRQRGHWVCDRGRGVVKPCGPLCNESCDQYQEPGTTGPQEDTTMPANKRIGWTLPASETVEGAPSDLTLEQWARAEKDAGRAGDAMRLIGVTGATFYTRLKQVQPQAAAPAKPAAPQRTEDEPCAGCRHDGLPLTDEPCHSCSALDPDETADHYELATQPAAETKAPSRETKRRPRGTAKPKPAAPAQASETSPATSDPLECPDADLCTHAESLFCGACNDRSMFEPLTPVLVGEDIPEDEDDGTAAEPTPPVDAEFRLEPVITVEGLMAFLRDEDLSREAELFCRGYNARSREVA